LSLFAGAGTCRVNGSSGRWHPGARSPLPFRPLARATVLPLESSSSSCPSCPSCLLQLPGATPTARR